MFPLTVLSNWQDHCRSASSPPMPQQVNLDERVRLWWSEAERNWGADRTQGLRPSRHTRSTPSPTTATSSRPTSTQNGSQSRNRNQNQNHDILPPIFSSLSRQPPNLSSLGLYHASPPPQLAPDSSASTSSSITLPTPSTFHSFPHRYGQQPTLPPLRSHGSRKRAASSSLAHPSIVRCPSPRSVDGDWDGGGSRHRHLPSLSGLDLPPLENGYRYRASIAGSDLASGEKDGDERHGRSGKSGWIGLGADGREGERGIAGERRASPNFRQSGGSDEDMSPVKRSWGGHVEGPVGIAALVSAAEEKSKEREG